jgi:hypothetical protein
MDRAQLQVWDMSKADKDFAQSDRDAEVPTEIGNTGQAMHVNAAPQQAKDPPPQQKPDEINQFNSWLDRAMPRLMEQLGGGGSATVTSPGQKPKH